MRCDFSGTAFSRVCPAKFDSGQQISQVLAASDCANKYSDFPTVGGSIGGGRNRRERGGGERRRES